MLRLLQRPALLGAICLLAASCASAPKTSGEAPVPLAGEPDPASALPGSAGYRIGPDDVVEVSVWRNEALSRTVPVRPDGFISLPLINDIQAAGLTPMELRQLLAQKLTTYIPSPEVSVIVREVHSAKVSVLGEVAHPGLYELRGPTTVLEILAHAGGLSPFASRGKIVVLRTRGGQSQKIMVDEDRALDERSHQNLALQSGDTVFVP